MFYRAGLILCLVAVLVSAQYFCPYPEEIEPCICAGRPFPILTCRRVHDTQVLLRVFENARQLHFLKFTLTESSLQYIPHQIFDDVVVEVLLLENVTLRNVFDEVPSNSDVREIYLSGVKVLGGLDWEYLGGFTNLDTVYMWDIPLRKLSDSLSHVSKKLRNLHCKSCQIKKLEDNLFADFAELDSVQLPYNEIVDIKRTMFPTTAKLRIIVMEYNKISSLPTDIFSDMPSLYQVYLEGNQLAALSEATFQPVFSQLTYLDVSANPIKCDCLIKWVLEEKRGIVKGKCAAPKAIRDKDIDELTREDIRC